MRINSLWISKYKNIENITLDFDSDHLITLLVGKNGLGKSNLIEILALIFRDLDSLNNEDDFKQWPNLKDQFEFRIEYSCRGNDLKIHCENKDFQVWLKNEDGEFNRISFRDFIGNRKEQYLPQYIIGYYSGENKRVRDIIKPYENIQFSLLKSAFRKPGVISPFRYMFFSENYHSQLLLIALTIYNKAEEYDQKINDLFTKYIEIEEIIDFELNFKSPDWDFTKIAGINKSVSLLTSNMQNKIDSPFWNLSGKIDKFLTALYDHHLNIGEPIAGLDVDDKEEILEFYNLTISSLYNDIKKEFPTALSFFDAFEATTIEGIDILKDVKFKVKKSGVDIPIEFPQLSEGEQQLLTVLGLLLIFSSEDCLFLLDEPDTHLNPQWQRDYVQLLHKFNATDSNSHIIVATHSPLIVQAAENADTFVFRKNTDNKIEVLKDPYRISNWRIDQVMMSDYFEIENTRPPKLDEFMQEREVILAKEIVTKEDLKKLSKIEEEMGELPSGETLNDFKTMHLLRSIISKYSEDDKNK